MLRLWGPQCKLVCHRCVVYRILVYSLWGFLGGDCSRPIPKSSCWNIVVTFLALFSCGVYCCLLFQSWDPAGYCTDHQGVSDYMDGDASVNGLPSSLKAAAARLILTAIYLLEGEVDRCYELCSKRNGRGVDADETTTKKVMWVFYPSSAWLWGLSLPLLGYLMVSVPQRFIGRHYRWWLETENIDLVLWILFHLSAKSVQTNIVYIHVNALCLFIFFQNQDLGFVKMDTAYIIRCFWFSLHGQSMFIRLFYQGRS